MKPSINRFVQFRIPLAKHHLPLDEEAWRPAVITGLYEHGDGFEVVVTAVDLTVFARGGHDTHLEGLIVPRTHVSKGTDIGCWRWPPRA